MNDPQTIDEFLKVLNKHRIGLEKSKSFHDPNTNAYQYLFAQANAFGGVDEAAYVVELLESLTIENSQWMTREIVGLLPAFKPTDGREVFVTAYLLVKDHNEDHRTYEWVQKAEKALKNLKILASKDRLEEALRPYGDRQDDFVSEARALLATNVTKGWLKNAHELTKKLVDNKPRDIVNEVRLLMVRIEKELGEKGFEKDQGRQIFFDARELLKDNLMDQVVWVEEAIVTLVALLVEKAEIKASRTERWWTKTLPVTVEAKPLADLRVLLAEKPERYHEALWALQVNEAVELLNKFKPKCTHPGCTKKINRKDGGTGPFEEKCKDHQPPVETVADLSAEASPELIAAFEAFYNGEGKKKKNKRGDKDRKEEVYS